jgi:hypothetical protein
MLLRRSLFRGKHFRPLTATVTPVRCPTVTGLYISIQTWDASMTFAASHMHKRLKRSGFGPHPTGRRREKEPRKTVVHYQDARHLDLLNLKQVTYMTTAAARTLAKRKPMDC